VDRAADEEEAIWIIHTLSEGELRLASGAFSMVVGGTAPIGFCGHGGWQTLLGDCRR